jgi:hypothetical protein
MSGANNEIVVFTVPSRPTTGQKVTFVARASDPSRAARIEILVNQRRVKACDDSVCTYLGGPFRAGTIRYAANAFDRRGNLTTSGWQEVTVRAVDTTPPVLRVWHQPSRPRTDQWVRIRAEAEDPGGVAKIEIKVEGRPMRTFSGATAGLSLEPFPKGTVTYEASAFDRAGNRAWSGRKSFVVTPVLPVGRSTISGRITNQRRFCKEVAAFNLDRPGQPHTGTVNRDTGKYQIRNLPDGRYRVVPVARGKLDLIARPKHHDLRCHGEQSHTADFEITGALEG